MSRKPPDIAQRRLAELTAPVARALSRAGGLSVLASLLWLGQAALVAWLIGQLLAGTAGSAGIAVVALGFAGVGVLRAGLGAWADAQVVQAADTVLAAERARLVAAEARRAPFDRGRPSSAAIAALAGEKLALLVPYLTRFRPARLRAVAVPLVILAVSASLSWVVALILLVAGPLIPVFMALVGMAAQEASERQMEEMGSLNSMLMDRLRALVDIRLLDAGARSTAQFRGAAEDLRSRTMAVLRIAFLSSTVLELFAAIGVAMVAVYVGFALLGEIRFGAWATPLTASEGVFLLLLAPEFFQPLRDMAAAWHDKAAAAAVARELAELEAGRGAEILGAGGVAEPLSGAPDIAVRGLVLRPGDGAPITVPDFDLAAGQTLAVTGPSGVGKSTLIAALGGMIVPEGGKISVCGQPLGPDIADGWRARLGWVPQAPHFFAGSLRSNLRIAAPGAGDAAISAALDRASASGVVARLPRGLLSQLGEMGHGVSGGEARRLTLARAGLGQPDVILADEPTADLDDETAAQVTEGLLALAADGASLIVATHDPRLAARMGQRLELAAEGAA